MKLVINPDYAALTDFIRNLPENFDHEGVTIYKARNEIKVIQAGNVQLNVKRYKVPHIINRFAYSYLREPKAVRAYQYAFRLLEKGIDTPVPVAYILFYEGGMLATSYFISLQMPGDTLYNAGREPLAGNEALFTALGDYTAQLHQAGVYHRDFSPGNILYRKEDAGYHFSLLDINRMEFGSVSLKKGCENFARLWGSDKAIDLTVHQYAKSMHYDADQCLAFAMKSRRKFWHQFQKRNPIPFQTE